MRFDADLALTTLAGFQRATVDHVFQRLYTDANPVRRFLVADETGLGKSMVARGVVARTVHHLQDVDSVRRIDIVYVCSNGEIARQNVKRLDVIGSEHSITSRLTLLARDARRLDKGTQVNGKAVNLVSFTPGTLPGASWLTGTVEERALIHVILADKLNLDEKDEWASLRLLQGAVQHVDTMAWWARSTRAEAGKHGGIEPRIANEFFRTCRRNGLLHEYRGHVSRIRRLGRVPNDIASVSWDLIGRMRTELARASVQALEPDLIILDEFQRFRHLLDPDSHTEAAELARSLFAYGDARVLLLSATPIKSFTYAEEAIAGDDHARDLGKILEFLTEGSNIDPAEIGDALSEYRRRAVTGESAQEARQQVEAGLTQVMSRTERPRVGEHGMLLEEDVPLGVEGGDLAGWVGLKRLADAIHAPMTLDYWKSAPYFANFLDGYKFGDRLKESLSQGEVDSQVAAAIRALQTLDRGAVERREPLDLGSPRLRYLAARTLGEHQHELLWVPPSLPYFEPGGPYVGVDCNTATKQLIFSSWSATPTAVASLLSYQADRLLQVPETELNRLTYRADGGKPGAMTTLALFWPNPGLARLCDPLALCAEDGPTPVPESVVIERAISLIESAIPNVTESRATTAEAAYWQVAIGAFGDSPVSDIDVAATAMAGGGPEQDAVDEVDAPRLLRLHVDLALTTLSNVAAQEAHHDLVETVARIGINAPGNVAWRALARIAGPAVTEAGHWRAAAILASGFRTLFNRAEAIGALDLHITGEPYWKAVLTYCGWGNLQALLDEHVHHLAISEGQVGAIDDAGLAELAARVRSTLSLRPSAYVAFDPHRPDERIRFPGSRFALRYGTARQADDEARLPEIRNAFNSPFWPWVLATTSVGQEGIDFHWWCHSIIHWNTPSNPVDFEQREGRVNRYGGLATRRNLAARHRATILASRVANPWTEAYHCGEDERSILGELAPHWVYPGPAQFHRVVMPYPLSTDAGRYRRIKDDLALYRLTFGQPRQEDLLEILKRRGVNDDPERIAELKLDLRPPGAVSNGGR